MKYLSFDQVENIYDVKNILINNLDSVICFMSDEALKYFTSLDNLSENLHPQFLRFVHYVDENFSHFGYFSFLNHKIATILAGAVYYQEYYDEIKDLSEGEVAILAKYSSSDCILQYKENILQFPKQILSMVETKTVDFFKRDEIMTLIAFFKAENKNDEEIYDFLGTNSVTELVQESFKWQEQALSKEGFYDCRRV